MAKKNSLLDKLIKASPSKRAEVLTKSDSFINRDFITTDIPILNVAFSGELDGGLATGITLLAGPPQTYKSSIALACVRAYLNKYPDGTCIWYDSEGGFTPEYMAMHGVDPERVLHVPVDHLEMLKFEMVAHLEEIKKSDRVIMIVDSIGNTGSQKELEDAKNEKSVADMARAKATKSLFRIITPSIRNRDIPCIAVCHTYDTMETYSKQVISGGKGAQYSANQAFIISKAQVKEKVKNEGDKVKDELTGFTFTLAVEKSRYVREKSRLPFTVLFNSGIQKYSGLKELAFRANMVVMPSNGWYSRVDEDGVIEEKKWRIKEMNSEEFWAPVLISKRFRDYVRNKYKLGAYTGNDYQDDIIDEEELVDE